MPAIAPAIGGGPPRPCGRHGTRGPLLTMLTIMMIMTFDDDPGVCRGVIWRAAGGLAPVMVPRYGIRYASVECLQ